MGMWSTCFSSCAQVITSRVALAFARHFPALLQNAAITLAEMLAGLAFGAMLGVAAAVALLMSAGVVAAASAVVSGSIVIAGNIVYWFERQGGCPP